MKYYSTDKRSGAIREISKAEALEYLKSNYTENVCTYEEMLNTESVYPCMFSNLEVKNS